MLFWIVLSVLSIISAHGLWRSWVESRHYRRALERRLRALAPEKPHGAAGNLGEHWACDDEPPCCECGGNHCCHDCSVMCRPWPPVLEREPQSHDLCCAGRVSGECTCGESEAQQEAERSREGGYSIHKHGGVISHVPDNEACDACGADDDGCCPLCNALACDQRRNWDERALNRIAADVALAESPVRATVETYSERELAYYLSIGHETSVLDVDLIASGYEFVCPWCRTLATLIEIPRTGEYIKCPGPCAQLLRAVNVEHAYG